MRRTRTPIVSLLHNHSWSGCSWIKKPQYEFIHESGNYFETWKVDSFYSLRRPTSWGLETGRADCFESLRPISRYSPSQSRRFLNGVLLADLYWLCCCAICCRVVTFEHWLNSYHVYFEPRYVHVLIKPRKKVGRVTTLDSVFALTNVIHFWFVCPCIRWFCKSVSPLESSSSRRPENFHKNLKLETMKGFYGKSLSCLQSPAYRNDLNLRWYLLIETVIWYMRLY
jgi:hypothetical protein